jgi:cytochrome b
MNTDLNEKENYKWDIIIRIFHWGLVASIATSYFSYQYDNLKLHEWAGYSALGLVSIRLIWGIIGSKNARFSHFPLCPKKVFAYIKTLPSKNVANYEGHNPLGSWSVIVMLIMVLVQGITGLFATDDILFYGPLYDYISDDFASTLTNFHKTHFYWLISVIGIHIFAVFYYLIYKRKNLIKAMILGK